MRCAKPRHFAFEHVRCGASVASGCIDPRLQQVVAFSAKQCHERTPEIIWMSLSITLLFAQRVAILSMKSAGAVAGASIQFARPLNLGYLQAKPEAASKWKRPGVGWAPRPSGVACI
jgi:hypothetical protein